MQTCYKLHYVDTVAVLVVVCYASDFCKIFGNDLFKDPFPLLNRNAFFQVCNNFKKASYFLSQVEDIVLFCRVFGARFLRRGLITQFPISSFREYTPRAFSSFFFENWESLIRHLYSRLRYGFNFRYFSFWFLSFYVFIVTLQVLCCFVSYLYDVTLDHLFL